jgi:Fe-S oxidoreductase
MLDTPTREIFWQVSQQWIFYSLAFITTVIFLWGLLKGVRFIRRGTTVPIQPVKKLGIGTTIKDILSHRPLVGEDTSRYWHLLLFFGFVPLFFVTCYLMLAHYGYEDLFTGTPYLLVTLVADLAGAGLMIGVLLALMSGRQGTSPEPERIRTKRVVLLLLGVVCLTGFFVEGLRIRIQGDPWQAWSPVGAVASRFFPLLTESDGPRLFKVVWWLHALLALGLLAWIPLSPRLRHMLFLPFNRAMIPVRPRSPTPLVDLQSLRSSNPTPGSVRLGIETASDTTRKQRLGFMACMECGRCERLCPAFQTGQPLTPRQYLRDLREYVGQCEERGEPVAKEPAASATQSITPSSLWACRLCRACEELCPAGIEHVPQLAEIRRAEVLGHGRLPDEGAEALRNLARTGNPYGASPVERTSWIQGERIPDHPADPSGEPLFLWTGCFQPGDEQKPRVLSCLVALLREFDAPFFIPQETASCCGDPARIMGEEDLFQTMAREQIQRIEASGAERVLVHCPHCYTVLKDAYPLLGARFSVIHTSEIFEGLIREMRLQSQGFPQPQSVVYHDPCFLGRYQEIVEPPRSILGRLPGLDLHDPPRTGKQGYCCGAGGGHFFMDLDLEERPSSQRLEEILGQEPDTLAVSCSFCFSMFDDALRRLSNPPSLRVADWLELLKEATVGEKG